ncbi:hypothetical protein BDV96DRAFT_607884 [Lophiotrema nucula]|uniref:Uncharacterized protein n=1 Tax=Lophiotrema nucula TaxID=690887 RepID=A0A6A5YEZ8_9PLEO|nr:hypothetical protein BDV96DRAFT_607884 [Lophiotrema nucula]
MAPKRPASPLPPPPGQRMRTVTPAEVHLLTEPTEATANQCAIRRFDSLDDIAHNLPNKVLELISREVLTTETGIIYGARRGGGHVFFSATRKNPTPWNQLGKAHAWFQCKELTHNTLQIDGKHLSEITRTDKQFEPLQRHRITVTTYDVHRKNLGHVEAFGSFGIGWFPEFWDLHGILGWARHKDPVSMKIRVHGWQFDNSRGITETLFEFYQFGITAHKALRNDDKYDKYGLYDQEMLEDWWACHAVPNVRFFPQYENYSGKALLRGMKAFKDQLPNCAYDHIIDMVRNGV